MLSLVVNHTVATAANVVLTLTTACACVSCAVPPCALAEFAAPVSQTGRSACGAATAAQMCPRPRLLPREWCRLALSSGGRIALPPSPDLLYPLPPMTSPSFLAGCASPIWCLVAPIPPCPGRSRASVARQRWRNLNVGAECRVCHSHPRPPQPAGAAAPEPRPPTTWNRTAWATFPPTMSVAPSSNIPLMPL
jgi:hypothetical protein